MNPNQLYIGLTGRMASGKGEVIRVLVSEGFKSVSLSDIVREEARKHHGEVNRSSLQDIGNGLRNQGGAGVLGRMIKEKILVSEDKFWSIDGIRNPAEVEELRELPGFFLIGVESDPDVLISRMVSRKRDTDIASENDLKARLDREWGIGEPQGGQQVGKCMDLADFTIQNKQTLADLEIRTREILREIRERWVKKNV